MSSPRWSRVTSRPRAASARTPHRGPARRPRRSGPPRGGTGAPATTRRTGLARGGEQRQGPSTVLPPREGLPRGRPGRRREGSRVRLPAARWAAVAKSDGIHLSHCGVWGSGGVRGSCRSWSTRSRRCSDAPGAGGPRLQPGGVRRTRRRGDPVRSGRSSNAGPPPRCGTGSSRSGSAAAPGRSGRPRPARGIVARACLPARWTASCTATCGRSTSTTASTTPCWNG